MGVGRQSVKGGVGEGCKGWGWRGVGDGRRIGKVSGICKGWKVNLQE